jgi:hypothetical protein
MIATTCFDASGYLDTPERQAAYIMAAFETGDPAFVRDAIGIVARARGMARSQTPPSSIGKASTRRLAKPEILSSAQ